MSCIIKNKRFNESKKWLVRDFDIVIDEPVLKSTHTLIIINYEKLKKHCDSLLKINFDLVIIDEVHLIKNPEAERTKYVKLLNQQKIYFHIL